MECTTAIVLTTKNLLANKIFSDSFVADLIAYIRRGGGERELLDVSLVVHPLLRWFFCLLGLGSFHFVPCIFSLLSFFAGALVYI